MRKIHRLFFMLLIILHFAACKVTEESRYTVSVTFSDGSTLSSSGKELEEYINGHCATVAWKLFCQKYNKPKTKKDDKDTPYDPSTVPNEFRFQCWGEGCFNVVYDKHEITVVSVIR